MQKLRSLNSSALAGHSARLFCAAWSHLFGRDQTRWLHSVYEKKPAHPANDIAERLALYSSGTIFLRGTITFPSSALINLGTVKAGRRIYDLVTKRKTNLSTTRRKEVIAGLDRPHVHGLGGDSANFARRFILPEPREARRVPQCPVCNLTRSAINGSRRVVQRPVPF